MTPSAPAARSCKSSTCAQIAASSKPGEGPPSRGEACSMAGSCSLRRPLELADGSQHGARERVRDLPAVELQDGDVLDLAVAVLDELPVAVELRLRRQLRKRGKTPGKGYAS